jgi:hypothetical protein
MRGPIGVGPIGVGPIGVGHFYLSLFVKKLMLICMHHGGVYFGRADPPNCGTAREELIGRHAISQWYTRRSRHCDTAREELVGRQGLKRCTRRARHRDPSNDSLVSRRQSGTAREELIGRNGLQWYTGGRFTETTPFEALTFPGY